MPRILTFEYVKDKINKEDLLVSNTYINNKSLLDIECNACKEIYHQSFSRYRSGYRHKHCPKKK